MLEGIDVRINALQASSEITRLKARYVRLVDTKRWDELEQLFARDFKFEGNWTSTGGAVFIDGLRGYLATAISAHELHTGEIEVVSETEARAIWPFSDFIDRRDQNGHGVHRRGFGHYHEEYRRESGGEWRFAAMRLTRIRVDCAVTPVEGKPVLHTCFSQDELVSWLNAHDRTAPGADR
jgi:hypothetical protein